MLQEFRDTNRFGRVSRERVSEFEATIGAPLPSDYRNFLLTHNGGRPTWPRLRFERDGTPDETVVEWFFALHDEPYPVHGEERLPPERVLPAHLKQPLQDFEGAIESEYAGGLLLPIARDPCANLFVLACGGDAHGRAWFHDHEGCELVALAPTFDAFIARLEPLPRGDWLPWLITE